MGFLKNNWVRYLWPVLALPLVPWLEFSAPADLGQVVLVWMTGLLIVGCGARLVDWPVIASRPRRTLLVLGCGSSLLLSSGAIAPHPPFTGDEPAYLVMASSLVQDADFQLYDDYRDEVWRDFGVEAYRPFLARGQDGKLYPHHGLGMGWFLSTFVHVFYRVRGWAGDPVGWMLLRGFAGLALGLGLGVAYRLAVERGATPRNALAAAGLAGLTCPLVFYSTQIYPDVPALGLLGVLALRNPSLQSVTVALLLLPQLGVKFLPPAVLLGLALIGRVFKGGARSNAAVLLMVLLIGVAGFLMMRPPLNLEARLTEGVLDRLALVPAWIFGYLVDQRAGLWFLAPAYLLAAVGLHGLNFRQNLFELAAVAGYVGIYAFHLDWGGLCPPGRPLVAILWLPILLMALGLDRVGSFWARGLAVVSIWIAATYALDPSALFLHLHPNAQEAASPLLIRIGGDGWDWIGLAPFISTDHWFRAVHLVWLVLVAGLLGLILRWPRPSVPAWLRVGVAVGLLAVALAWGSQLDPSTRFSPISTGTSAVRLASDAGPAWSDGWLPSARTVAVWIRHQAGARLRLQSVVPTVVRVRGRGRADRLEIRPDAPAELQLAPLADPGTERLEFWVSTGASPAEISGSADRRVLGVRISVVE